MILTEKNTVFILGAGASVPYGYPTGFDLSQQIKGYLGNLVTESLGMHEHLAPMLRELGHGIKELKEFYECFFGAATYSIDKFLENRPDFGMLGKLLIAYFLKVKEGPNLIFNRLRENNWYAELFNRLDVTVDNAKKLQHFFHNIQL